MLKILMPVTSPGRVHYFFQIPEPWCQVLVTVNHAVRHCHLFRLCVSYPEKGDLLIRLLIDQRSCKIRSHFPVSHAVRIISIHEVLSDRKEEAEIKKYRDDTYIHIFSVTHAQAELLLGGNFFSLLEKSDNVLEYVDIYINGKKTKK